MKKKIVLVGCGNVGSRHLQAISKLPFQSNIHIIEPNRNSQELAKTRLEEVKYDRNAHSFFWHQSIKDLEPDSDLVILATPSHNRVDLVEELVELKNVRFLIEKMVCQSEEDYVRLLSLLKKNNAIGWVNTPRRYFESYKKIKEQYLKSKLIFLSVIAGNQGLGSNAIHYIDLFSWFCEDYKISLNGDFLFNKLFENKRGNEYVELAGSIFGTSKSGSVLTINFFPYENLPTVVNIVGNKKHLMIDETNEKLFTITNLEKLGNQKFENDYVSNTTTAIVEEILNTDNCLLPTMQDSSYAHYELFRIFNNHIKKLTNENRKLCPIT